MVATKYGKVGTRDLSTVLGFGEYCPEYLELCIRIREKLPSHTTVEALRTKLGPQDQCWVGGSQNRKFYVWRLEELWVLAHNVKGIVLEVPPDTTKSRAWELWRLFCSKVDPR
jgi:hypothetical protein